MALQPAAAATPDGVVETVTRAMASDSLPVGPETCERAARVLEQQLGAVWAAVLESHGVDPAAGWRLVVLGLRLEPLARDPGGG